jgi:multidrug resistance efflux pump
LRTRLGVAAVIVLAGYAACSTGSYRVTADAVLEGKVQRVVAAPIDGFIRQALVRPGDEVQAGQILGQMDDKDLKLEETRWDNALQQHQKEAREAMAKHDPAKISIATAEARQAEAQLALLREKLARTVITAPFDGVVLEGDLSQSQGAPVTRGDVLFRLAPLEDYRVILEVDERDIAAMQTSLPGQLRLAGLPEQPIAFRVMKLTSVATAREGKNVFRVEAQLNESAQASDKLRPGMKGVAKVDAGERRLLWLWTHGITDWLRVRAWSWLP